jgi:hypothetical protein
MILFVKQNLITVFVLLTFTVTYAKAELIAWWPLDEIENRGVNEVWSVSEATGSYGNASVWGPADIGIIPGPWGGTDRATGFHQMPAGEQQAAICTNTTNVVPSYGDFTVLVWMKTYGSHPNRGNLFSNSKLGTNSRLDLKVDQGRAMLWSDLFGVIDSDVVVDDSQWHEVGMSRKGYIYSLLVDDVMCGTAISSTPLDTVWEWMIGRARSNDFSFNGYIADVKVYNTDYTKIIYPAQNPLPGNHQNKVSLNPMLQWQTGLNPDNTTQLNPSIKKHYLFGNFYNVNNSLQLIATLDKDVCYYNEPLNLQHDATYTWYIEECVDDRMGGVCPPGDPRNIRGSNWQFSTISSIPVIRKQPESIAVEQGKTATLIIEVNSLSPVNYTWYRSMDRSVDTPQDDSVIGGNYKLVSIMNISISFEGYYFCKVSNYGTLPIGSEPPVYSDIACIGIKRQVAYWTLDNTDFSNGQYIDVCGEDSVAQNAIVQGNPNFTQGILGGAVKIDAANGWANSGTWNPSEFTEQLTVSAWIKWNGSSISGDGPGIVSKWGTEHNYTNNYWSLYLSSGNSDHPGLNYIVFSSWNGGEIWSGPQAVKENQWVHIVATVDENKTGRLYVNGELAGTDTTWSFGSKRDAPLLIGGAVQNLYHFPGMIDDIKIYNYAIAEINVARMYYELSGEKPCVQSFKPEFDLDGNCTVDMLDFVIFAEQWKSSG